jgi:hypothetical protein
MEDSMARVTKDLESPDVQLSAWEQPAKRATTAKVADARAAVASARAHFATFSDHELSIPALMALDALTKAQAALADAIAEDDNTLEQARVVLRESRLPRENELRRAQYLKARELASATETLYAHILESKRLGATAPSPMSIGEIVPFSTLINEEPHRTSALVHVARDLKERGIDVE